MPEGPRGGPRPFAESHHRININFASSIVSEDDIKKVKRGMPLNNEFHRLFEEELSMQIKEVKVTTDSGTRAINITLRSDFVMLYKEPDTNKIDIMTEWFNDNIGLVSSISIISE